MQNLANQHAGQAEVVGIFACACGLLGRVDHRSRYANDGKVVAHSGFAILEREKQIPRFARNDSIYSLLDWRKPCLSATIAERIASYIWLYPVQRHRLPLRASRISSSDGSGFPPV